LRIHLISRALRRRDYAIFSRIVRLYDQAKLVAISITNIANNKGPAPMGLCKQSHGRFLRSLHVFRNYERETNEF
jgi:hypothetical protein